MCALSIIFHIKIANPRLTPFTYADNWTFFSRDEKTYYAAMIQTLNMIHTLRMEVDMKKSWAWATHREGRKQCEHIALLFPGEKVTVQIKKFAKDLGSHMSYATPETMDA